MLELNKELKFLNYNTVMMKFEIFILLIFGSIYESTIVLKEKSNHIVPESNKLEIQFSRNGGPVAIETENIIEKIDTDGTMVNVNGPDSVGHQSSQSKSQSYQTIYDGPQYDQNHEIHQNHENLQTLQPQHHTEEPVYDEHQEMLNHFAASMIENAMKPLTKDEAHLNSAYNQLDELQGELSEALKDSGGKMPVMIDPKVLKTLISYLEHLDYIHKKEEGDQSNSLPPKVPDHLRASDVEMEISHHGEGSGSEELSHSEESEDPLAKEQHEKEKENEERLKKLKYEIDELNSEIDQIKTTIHSEEELAELEQERDDMNDELEDEQELFAQEELENEIEKDIEKTEETKEEFEHKGENLELIEKLAEEKIEMEENDLQVKSREEILENITKLDEEIVLIDNQILSLGESEPEKVIELNEQRNKLEEEKKTEQEELKKIDVKDNSIPNPISELNMDENSMVELGNSQLGLAEEIEDKRYKNSYQNLTHLIETMDTIQIVFNSFYQNFPEETDEQTLLDDSVAFGKFYEKVRSFSVMLGTKSELIQADMNFVKERIVAIKLDDENILDFYDLRKEFEKVEYSKEEMKKEFDNKRELILEELKTFKEDAENVMKNLESLMTLEKLLNEDTTNYLEEKDAKEWYKVLDKMLIFILNAGTMKGQFDEITSEIKIDLNQLLARRERITLLINDMNKIADGVYMDPSLAPLESGYQIIIPAVLTWFLLCF